MLLILAKNAEEELYHLNITLKGKRKTKIDESMLIEDLVDLAGVEAVAKYFSRPLGFALFSDENFVLPAKDGKLSTDEFVNNTGMMMPLKNLASFSGEYTKSDLQKTMQDFQKYLDENL